MDSISFQANAMISSSTASLVQSTDAVVVTPPLAATDFGAVIEPKPLSGSVQQFLGSVRALSPTNNPETGQTLNNGRLDPNKVGILTDISTLPPHLRQALMTFRHVALESLVPNVAVTVVSGTTSSIKRVQQGQ